MLYQLKAMMNGLRDDSWLLHGTLRYEGKVKTDLKQM
jgi:hypothetical protein